MCPSWLYNPILISLTHVERRSLVQPRVQVSAALVSKSSSTATGRGRQLSAVTSLSACRVFSTSMSSPRHTGYNKICYETSCAFKAVNAAVRVFDEERRSAEKRAASYCLIPCLHTALTALKRCNSSFSGLSKAVRPSKIENLS
jgi:hypothetical protein